MSRSREGAYGESVVTHLSVITATVPRVNGFLSDLRTGQIGTQITGQHYELGPTGIRTAIGSKHESMNRSLGRNEQSPHFIPHNTSDPKPTEEGLGSD